MYFTQVSMDWIYKNCLRYSKIFSAGQFRQSLRKENIFNEKLLISVNLKTQLQRTSYQILSIEIMRNFFMHIIQVNGHLLYPLERSISPFPFRCWEIQLGREQSPTILILYPEISSATNIYYAIMYTFAEFHYIFLPSFISHSSAHKHLP